MSQLPPWHGFPSGLRTYPRELSGDLRELERFLGQLRTSVATLISAEPISSGSTIAVTEDRTLTAGAGLTGGGDLSADRTFNVGAGTGITVAADTVGLANTAVTPGSYTYSSITVDAQGRLTAAATGSAPAALASTTPTDITLTTSTVGVGTTAARDDHRHGLDQTIAPTWTGVHTFSAQDVHNAGIDLGTSGVIDSNVDNAPAAASFKLQPAVAQAAGTDRYLFRLNDSSANSKMTVFSNGQVEWNGLSGANTGFLQVSGTLPSGPYLGINFAPSAFTSTGTIGAITTAVGGALFQVNAPNSTSAVGGYFIGSAAGTGTLPEVWAAEFQTQRATNNTTTSLGCIYLIDSTSNAKGTITTWRGIYGASTAAGPSATNRYWIDLTEITATSGSKNSILLQQSGSASTYKALAFRDQDSWINSRDAAHLDLNATTSVDVNIGTTEQFAVTSALITFKDVFDIAVGTGTGTKIGTATTQKLGFWNTAPIVQPTTAIAAATFTANTSGIADDTATWDGYTIGQVVKALRNEGLLA